MTIASSPAPDENQNCYYLNFCFLGLVTCAVFRNFFVHHESETQRDHLNLFIIHLFSCIVSSFFVYLKGEVRLSDTFGTGRNLIVDRVLVERKP